MLGSKPAKATIASADLNLEISPNSEIMPAHEIGPIPLIDKVGGSNSLMMDVIFSSRSSILELTSLRREIIDDSSNSIYR